MSSTEWPGLANEQVARDAYIPSCCITFNPANANWAGQNLPSYALSTGVDPTAAQWGRTPIEGDMYWHAVDDVMRVYDGSSWASIVTAAGASSMDAAYNGGSSITIDTAAITTTNAHASIDSFNITNSGATATGDGVQVTMSGATSTGHAINVDITGATSASNGLDINITQAGATGHVLNLASSSSTGNLINSTDFIVTPSGGVTINDTGNDVDFRTETNNMAYALYLDGGKDSVVLGSNTDTSSADLLVAITRAARTATASTNYFDLAVQPAGAVTVPAGTTAWVATASFNEPNITATGTVTNAATVYISGAPSEGGNNYALYATGAGYFTGALTVDGNLSCNGSISGTFTYGDSDFLNIGDGNDLRISSNGTDVFFQSATSGTVLNVGSNEAGDTFNDIDVRVYGSTGSQSILLDASGDTVTFNGIDIYMNDNDNISFGDSQDVVVQWDATDLTITAAAADATVVKVGAAANQIDWWFTGTGPSTWKYDSSAKTITHDDIDLYLGDNDNISLGDSQDIVIQYASATSALTITAAAADQAMVVGADGANEIVCTWHMSTAGADFIIDATNDVLLLDGCDIRVEDADEVQFGDSGDAGILWSTGDADNHALAVGLGASLAVHVCQKADTGTDWNVVAASDPTLYIHGATTPATEYISIYTDETDAHLNATGANWSFEIGGTAELTLAANALNLVGSTLYGSSSADGNLVLSSTSNATKGMVTIANGEEGIMIGSSTARGTPGTNALHVFGGTAPSGAANGLCSLYSNQTDATAELVAIDAAGNTTVLSPHSLDGDYIIHSYSAKKNKTLHIDLEKLVNALVAAESDLSQFVTYTEGKTEILS